MNNELYDSLAMDRIENDFYSYLYGGGVEFLDVFVSEFRLLEEE